MNEERWLPIEGFPGYSVSDLGHVRCEVVSRGRKVGRNFRPNTSQAGYRQVRIRKDGKTHVLMVHKTVMHAFVGPRPEGMQIRHLDGDKDNNRLSNLAYGTPQQNGQDKVRHGTSSAGERNVRAKLTEQTVAELRALHAFGVTAKRIAEYYRLNPSTVYRIVNGKYWQEASNRRIDRATT